MELEAARSRRLVQAQDRALALFAEVERAGLIAPGRRDREVSNQIRDLAHDLYGVDRFWHKRIVRSGPHTLQPYRSNPPDRLIGADDIVLCDFGPVFADWEADLGRTFVLGDDPVKHRLRDDLPVVFAAGQRFYREHPDVTGEELYGFVVDTVTRAGWEHGATHAGHLIGEFPHERIAGDDLESYITTGSTQPMRRTDRTGRQCHWILEVHLVDRARGFGGFFEQLLDPQA